MIREQPRDRQGRRVFRPEPAPVRVPTTRILLAGTLLWAVALVLTVGTGGDTPESAVVARTCVMGVVIGLAGLAWARTRRADPSR